jgi:uncharacterized C2H2 Zn-finger protein
MIAGKVSATDMEAYNKEATDTYNVESMMACPNCGRTFVPDRLTVHLRSCNKAHGRADKSPSPTRGPGGAGGGAMPKGSPSGGISKASP